MSWYDPVCCVWARDGQCHIHGTTFGRNVGVLGMFETHPRAVAHVGAEIASWDAEPAPLPAWALVDGKHRPHPDCRACDWPASRCGNPNCPALPITASEMHRAFHYVAMRWLQEQGATVT